MWKLWWAWWPPCNPNVWEVGRFLVRKVARASWAGELRLVINKQSMIKEDTWYQPLTFTYYTHTCINTHTQPCTYMNTYHKQIHKKQRKKMNEQITIFWVIFLFKLQQETHKLAPPLDASLPLRLYMPSHVNGPIPPSRPQQKFQQNRTFS